MTLFLSFCLFFVMFAHGAALRSGDLGIAGADRSVWQGIGLKLLAMPVIAALCAWMFDLSGPASAGMMLVALAPASIGALPFGGLLGADVPRLKRVIGLSTLAALIWLPLIGIAFLGIRQGLTGMISAVVLPLVAGFLLRDRLGGSAQMIAMIASVLGGLMIVIALAWGWPRATGATAQAALLLAIAVAVLGLYTARAMGQGGHGNASATTLALLLSETAVPIGLAAQIWGDEFGPYAVPAAIYAIAAYGVAIILVVMRLRRRA